MEQLFVVGRDNGKAILRQLLAQLRVEVLQLLGVDEVTDVHTLSFSHVKVQLQQFVLALLQPFHKRLFLVRILQGFSLIGSPVVVVAPRLTLLLLDIAEVERLVELPHQRVVPRSAFIDATNVGILEGETLSGGRGIAEHPQVADAEGRHIHVVVDAVE